MRKAKPHPEALLVVFGKSRFMWRARLIEQGKQYASIQLQSIENYDTAEYARKIGENTMRRLFPGIVLEVLEKTQTV